MYRRQDFWHPLYKIPQIFKQRTKCQSPAEQRDNATNREIDPSLGNKLLHPINCCISVVAPLQEGHRRRRNDRRRQWGLGRVIGLSCRSEMVTEMTECCISVSLRVRNIYIVWTMEEESLWRTEEVWTTKLVASIHKVFFFSLLMMMTIDCLCIGCHCFPFQGIHSKQKGCQEKVKNQTFFCATDFFFLCPMQFNGIMLRVLLESQTFTHINI